MRVGVVGNPPPEVSPGVVPRRHALAAGDLLVLLLDPLDLLLDVGEGVEGYVGDAVLLAVVLEPEPSPSEQDVRFPGGGQIGDAVADEDDKGHGAVGRRQLLDLAPCLGHGDGLVVAEIIVVAPDGLPGGAVGADLGVVGDDIDAGRLLLAQELVQDPPQNGLKTGRDDVEGDVVVEAEPVEGLEVGVYLERLLHDGETVVERHVQRRPHLLGHVPKRPFSALELLVELPPPLRPAAVAIEKYVACVLHEDRSVEV